MVSHPPSASMCTKSQLNPEEQPEVVDILLEGVPSILEILSPDQFNALPSPDRGGFGISRSGKTFVRVTRVDGRQT